MIVHLWMSRLAKNKKAPRKTQKNNNLRILNIKSKCQVKGAQFLHLACQGCRLAPLSNATGYNINSNRDRLLDKVAPLLLPYFAYFCVILNVLPVLTRVGL